MEKIEQRDRQKLPAKVHSKNVTKHGKDCSVHLPTWRWYWNINWSHERSFKLINCQTNPSEQYY